jgi:CRISPR-associated exonuclease Cas4
VYTVDTVLVVLFLLLVASGLAALRWSRRKREQTGLPRGRVVYTDTGAWDRCEKPLFSKRYLLTGRPDYLVEERGRVIPVEVKFALSPPIPYRSHVLQLAAYCLLIEEEYGQAPPYGIIKYRDQSLAIDYSPRLRAELLDTLANMRHDLAADDIAPSHSNPNRCRRCGYKADCHKTMASDAAAITSRHRPE